MPKIRKRELPEQVEKVGEVYAAGNTHCLKFKRIGEKDWEAVKNKDPEALETQRKRWLAAILIEPTGKRIVQTSLSDAQLKQAELAFEAMRQQDWFQSDDDAGKLLELILWAMPQQELIAACRQPPLVPDCVHAFLRHKEILLANNRLRKPTYTELSRFLKTAPDSFAKRFPARRISEVSTIELSDFIENQSSEAKKIKCRTVLHGFYEFACGKQNPKPWILKNLIKGTAKLDLQQGQVSSYSYKEITKLITAADELKLLPYLIFRLFTLARREEVRKLFKIGGADLSKNGYIGTNLIHFSKDMVKTRKEQLAGGRRVPISPILKKWLVFFRKHKTPLKFNAIKETRLKKIIPKKSGISTANLLRHTSITFHAKFFGKSDKTAEMAGHTVEMLWTRYHDFIGVNDQEAKKLYSLSPQSALVQGLIKSV